MLRAVGGRAGDRSPVVRTAWSSVPELAHDAGTAVASWRERVGRLAGVAIWLATAGGGDGGIAGSRRDCWFCLAWPGRERCARAPDGAASAGCRALGRQAGWRDDGEGFRRGGAASAIPARPATVSRPGGCSTSPNGGGWLVPW